MSIKQYSNNKGSFWVVRATLGKDSNGNRVEAFKRGFPTKREATQWLTREQINFDNGESKYNTKKPTDAMTVNELYNIWIDTYQHTVEESTLVKTMSVFRIHILPRWGKYQLKNIEWVELQTWVNELAQRYVKQDNMIITYFKKLLDTAIRRDLLTKNPFIMIDVPKKKRGQQVKKSAGFLDREQFIAMLRLLDDQYKHINLQAYTGIRLLMFTGMRPSELVALTWGVIDFKQGTLNIRQAIGRGLNGEYKKGTKTYSGTRSLYLDNNMLRVLSEWYNATPFKQGSDYVFHDNGKRLQTQRPNKWVKAFTSRFGLDAKMSPYTFRHTFATLVLESGSNPRALADAMGHSDATMTLNVYASTTAKSAKETGTILGTMIDTQSTEK